MSRLSSGPSLKCLLAFQVLNVQLNDLNRLDIEFTNPLTIELVLARLSLVVESTTSSSYLIDLHDYADSSIREFKIPPKAIDFKLSTGFVLDQLGSYKITGKRLLPLLRS